MCLLLRSYHVKIASGVTFEFRIAPMIASSATLRLSAAFFISLGTPVPLTLANDVTTRTLNVGGTERKYILSKPDAEGPRPTIFILHGGGMSANHSLRTNGIEPLVEHDKFVAVYPNALRREWNDGREARIKERGYVDDVAYMR